MFGFTFFKFLRFIGIGLFIMTIPMLMIAGGGAFFILPFSIFALVISHFSLKKIQPQLEAQGHVFQKRPLLLELRDIFIALILLAFVSFLLNFLHGGTSF